GLQAARTRDAELGRKRSSHHHVLPALREADVECAVGAPRLNLGVFEGAADPGSPHQKAAVLPRCVEVAGRDDKLVFCHLTGEKPSGQDDVEERPAQALAPPSIPTRSSTPPSPCPNVIPIFASSHAP